MKILASDLTVPETYKLLTGVVVPRPIAWISTLSEAGHVNLAPFSCFTFVSSEPPMIGVSIGGGMRGLKDTPGNMRRTGEFVVNIADDSMIQQVHATSFDFPPDVSEAEKFGLATIPSDIVGCPRLRDVPVSMECRFSTAAKFGQGATEFYVGEVVCFHIRDELYQSGKVHTAQLRPICRIAGPNYATLGPIVTQSAPGHWGPPGAQ